MGNKSNEQQISPFVLFIIYRGTFSGQPRKIVGAVCNTNHACHWYDETEHEILNKYKNFQIA